MIFSQVLLSTLSLPEGMYEFSVLQRFARFRGGSSFRFYQSGLRRTALLQIVGGDKLIIPFC